MSNYQDALRELALEADEDARLARAAEIDRDADELNERWDARDEYNALAAERDQIRADYESAIAERDEWRTRYADRFFDSGEGVKTASQIIDAHNADIRRESRPRGYAALWADKEN